MSKLKRLSRLVGAAGIEPGERPGAQRLGIVFEVPMLVAALWVLLSWWSKRGTDPATADIYDLILWSMFVTETVLLSIAVRDTANYLKTNWLNLVIIALGFTGLAVLLWRISPTQTRHHYCPAHPCRQPFTENVVA